MMDFSGSNRGYIFVRYTNKEDAKRAVKELNNYEVFCVFMTACDKGVVHKLRCIIFSNLRGG